MKTITVLDLEGNNFRGIPEALRGAKQLSHLDLSCNHDLQIGLQDVHILLQLDSLSILDLSKVSERLPLEGPPLPNEVGCSLPCCPRPRPALDPCKTLGCLASFFLMCAVRHRVWHSGQISLGRPGQCSAVLHGAPPRQCYAYANDFAARLHHPSGGPCGEVAMPENALC